MRRLEPVPPECRQEAMDFLLAGDRRDAGSIERARAFGESLARGRRPTHLWWGWRGDRCGAAALVVENPGRHGTLFYCPLEAPGVDRGLLAELLRRMGGGLLDGGFCMIQRLLELGAADEVSLLESAGYERLAELLYLERDLAQPLPASDGVDDWRRFGEFAERELADVIAATYRQSLDCPALCQARGVGDAVASHKGTGLFQPESWWMARVEGRPAGCILANGSLQRGAWDVVYMGVVPEFRGRGIGRALLRHVAAQAREKGMLRLKLAVDVGNRYARELYADEGFRGNQRRLAYALLRRAPGRPEALGPPA